MTKGLNSIFLEVLSMNQLTFEKQLEGLSHDDSLIQPPFRGNCLNWVAGHVIQCRNELFQFMNVDPIWDTSEAEWYETGSNPVINSDQGLELERLKGDFQITQQYLEEKFSAMEEFDFEEMLQPGENQSKLVELINGYLWHETYHLGQFEFLRQLAGKNDHIF